MSDNARNAFRGSGFGFVGRLLSGDAATMEIFPDYVGAELSVLMLALSFYFLGLKGVVGFAAAYGIATYAWLGYNTNGA